MLHHVIYWRMARREVDVDDDELTDLRRQDGRDEVYIEFVDGRRTPHAWDDERHRWVAVPAGV